MRTLKLVLAYDGTAYHGWQLQPNGVTVQHVLEEAIGRILGPHRTHVAGRTDAGVHALGQVASFRTGKTMDAATLLRALNAVLPEDVAVRSVEDVSNEFDPRRDARGKLYRYRIWTETTRPVLVRNQVWQVWGLDWEAIERAARLFEGTHDFSSFEGRHSTAAHCVRTLSRVAVLRTPPAEHEAWIEIEGNGFVKHMVRNIVGTLVEVGRGAHPPEWVNEVIAAKDREAAGQTAPSQGLTLVEVFY